MTFNNLKIRLTNRTGKGAACSAFMSIFVSLGGPLSYLTEAVNQLGVSDKYYTPSHVIDYIESAGNNAKAIYGNPPFPRLNTAWSDIIECAQLGLTIVDTAATLEISRRGLMNVLKKNPDIHNLFERNPGKAAIKAQLGYAGNGKITKNYSVYITCETCKCSTAKKSPNQRWCDGCRTEGARVVAVLRSRDYYARNPKPKSNKNIRHIWKENHHKGGSWNRPNAINKSNGKARTRPDSNKATGAKIRWGLDL